MRPRCGLSMETVLSEPEPGKQVGANVIPGSYDAPKALRTSWSRKAALKRPHSAWHTVVPQSCWRSLCPALRKP